MECLNSITEMNIKENFLTISCKDMELWLAKMEINMKGNGKKI